MFTLVHSLKYGHTPCLIYKLAVRVEARLLLVKVAGPWTQGWLLGGLQQV